MMAVKSVKKRHLWTHEQELDLIDIWREPEIAEKVEDKLYRQKAGIHEKIAQRMRDLGHTTITSAVVITKLKNLRAEHKAVRDVFIRGTGKGSANVIRDDPKSACPHYHLLNEILGGKPSVDPPAGLLGQSSVPPPPRPSGSAKRPNNTSSEGVPICVGCKKECGSHRCKMCRRPTHIIPPCLGEQSKVDEEGYGSVVTCRKCKDNSVYVVLSQEDDEDEDGLDMVEESQISSVPPKKRKIIGWENEYDDSPSPPPHFTDSNISHSSSSVEPSTSQGSESVRQQMPTTTPSTRSSSESSSPVTPPASSSTAPFQETPSIQPIRRRRPSRDTCDETNTKTKKDRTVDAVTKSLREMQEYNFKRWKTIDERQEAELRRSQSAIESKIDKVVSVIDKQIVERREERKQTQDFQQQFLAILSQSLSQQQQPPRHFQLGHQQPQSYNEGHHQQYYQL